MPAYLAKPVSPVWQPGKAPAGCRGYWLLGEGSGRTARNLAGSSHGTFVGTPAWQRGLYGPQLGGFSTSNYASANPAPPLIGPGTYPCWCAAMFTSTTSTPSGWLISQGNSANSTAVIGLRINLAANIIEYILGDSAGYASVTKTEPKANDGKPHVLMGVSYSASRHELFLDGISQGTSSTTAISFTVNTLALGVWRGSSVAQPLAGSLLWAGCGNGSVPSPLALASDLLSGLFSAVRPRSSLALIAATLGGTPPATVYSPAALLMGF